MGKISLYYGRRVADRRKVKDMSRLTRRQFSGRVAGTALATAALGSLGGTARVETTLRV
jgi:hypothetical protein